MPSFFTTTATASNDSVNEMATASSTTRFLTFPFRRQRKHYTINPPDDTYQVVYLGNVFTCIAKGEECLEKPLSLIWHTYCSRQRAELPMKLTVTRSGLKTGNIRWQYVSSDQLFRKSGRCHMVGMSHVTWDRAAETKQQGITEYWSHRITYCLAPSNLPRVFCWVYKHEGKKLKPELRCHAALCKKPSDPYKIAQTLEHYLRAALQEYRREKLCRQNARINALTFGQSSTTGPKRKLMLQTGSLNFRPPIGRSKSAPRLFAIDEESEYSDEQQDEYSDADSLCYEESPAVSGDVYSTNSVESADAVEIPFSRHYSFRSRDDEKQYKLRRLCNKSLVQEQEQRNGSVASSEFSSSLEESGPSSVCSDDGVQSTINDSENPGNWEIRRLPSVEKERSEQRETDTISEESGYIDFDDGCFNSTTIDCDNNCDPRSSEIDCEIQIHDSASQYDEQQVTAL